MRCWALNLVVSNDTRTIRRGRSGRRTMGPSIDGGSRIGPPKTQQSARKYRNLRVKMTRPTPKTRDLRSRSDAHQVPLDYRRPFKIGNIVQTPVHARGSRQSPPTRHSRATLSEMAGTSPAMTNERPCPTNYHFSTNPARSITGFHRTV